MFEKHVQVLVLGAAYERNVDVTCCATTVRNRRDEWIAVGVFEQLEQICLEAFDKIVVKTPCGGEAAGKSPVDRGKQGTKRSVLSDRACIPLGCVIAVVDCHDSPLLRETLEHLDRFELRFGVGLP